MHVLVVDQCSSSKAVESDADRVDLGDLRDPDAFRETSDDSLPARDLYTGKQQRRIGNAVRTLRQNGHEVDRWFVSAGFGLVAETEELPPYDATFSSMNGGEIGERGRELSITDDLVDVIDDQFDLAFLALGTDYYRAIDLDRVLVALSETTVVLFNREDEAERWEHVLSIPARTEQARENGSSVISLKGTYIERFATRLGSESSALDHDRLRELVTDTDTSRTTMDDFRSGS